QIGGTVTVIGSVFTRNSAGTGGGLLNLGSASVSRSAFTGNSATAYFGGGLYNAGTAKVSRCAFTRNTAILDGGGLDNTGTLPPTPPQDPNTFAGNTPDDVGGLQLRRRHHRCLAIPTGWSDGVRGGTSCQPGRTSHH